MISIQSLSYSYSKGREILKNITLELIPGNIYGLLGLNGEGKTTFIKLIEGLLIPKQGEILLGNLSSKSRSVKYFDQVFFLPDQSKLPDMKISDFGRIYGGFYSKFNYQEYEKNIYSFNIQGNQQLRGLSLGQHRKVHIAFALACNTPVLLMDEPSNGLDIPSKSIFRKLLAKYMTEEKIFVISTHQIRDVDTLLDHLLILKQGELVMNKSLFELSNEYRITKDLQNDEEIIFQHSELDDPIYLVKNNQKIDKKLDIEFLFNAIVQSNQTISL